MGKYIGKRIVPKHCGYWEGERSYEMLSVVYEKTSGNSYISRQEVPPGTDILQEDYWALCSDFNMQMDVMGKHFTETEQRIQADNTRTAATIRADNDETEQLIRENNRQTAETIRGNNAETAETIKNDNDETEKAILKDNADTRQYVDGSLADTTKTLTDTVTSARTAMTEQKAEFDDTADLLNKRMDSVLASGTGTGETEILDARVDADGNPYESLGGHIRSILPDAAEESRTIFDSMMMQYYTAGILEKADRKLHEGELSFPYGTSTFSGWVSKYVISEDTIANEIRFVIRARENPVTKVRVRIALEERTDAAVIFETVMDIDIQPEVTETLKCPLPGLVFQKDRIVFIGVETDAVCTQGFGFSGEEKVSWYTINGSQTPLEKYSYGTKYHLYMELLGYKIGRFQTDEIRIWEQQTERHLETLQETADDYRILEAEFSREDRLGKMQDLLPTPKTSLQYNSSTFTGWAAPVGKVKDFDTIFFSVKNRSEDTPIEKIRCVIARENQDGEILADETQTGWHILPGETNEIEFHLSQVVENAEEANLYFGFECEQFVSIYAGSTGINLNAPDYGSVCYNSNGGKPPFELGKPLNLWSHLYDPDKKNTSKMQVQFAKVLKDYYFGETLKKQVQTLIDGKEELNDGQKEEVAGMIQENEELSDGQKKLVVEMVQGNEKLNDSQKAVVREMFAPRVVLPEVFHAVVGDTLQLFYRGLIEHPDPYVFNIEFKCSIGKNTARYFEVTPEAKDAGDHALTVNVRDHRDHILATAAAILRVHTVHTSPAEQKNILCIGDSLTSSGSWCREAMRRLTENGGTPSGLGLSNIRFIGTKKNAACGYEGYGGWTWGSYLAEPKATALGMWVYGSHDKDSSDQHSLWMDADGNLWSMETIEAGRIKFTRYNSHTGVMPVGSGTLKHYQNASHTADLVFEETVYAEGNPFWDADEGKVNFTTYCERNGFGKIDYLYTLLTWNGLGGYYAEPDGGAVASHVKNAKTLLRIFHSQYPDAKVKMMGIQMPSLNGGCGNNYGAGSVYSNWYGLCRSVMGMNLAYRQMAEEEEFRDYVEFINVSGQFDSEYNMPRQSKPVNTRSVTTEQIGTNGVHPSMDGYMQIGDAAFRSMVSELATN